MHVTENGGAVELTAEQALIIEAVSPTVDLQRVEGGVEITVHDVRGEQSAEVMDGVAGAEGPRGPEGEQGPAGADGVSPTVTVTDITGGHRVSITDAEGTQTFDVMDGETPSAPVQDVQVNGTSVLSNGVANVPIADNNNFGVVKINAGYGIKINSNGQIQVQNASTTGVKDATSDYYPITPSRQHNATFYGLAKAAGDTTQSASANAVGTYTESAKSAISEMLNGSVSVSGTTPSITAKPGIRYVCGECATLAITVPATGIIDVAFTSGSTPTVLTVTPPSGVTAVKWAGGFDPTSLDADTVYCIRIMDGKYASVQAWA